MPDIFDQYRRTVRAAKAAPEAPKHDYVMDVVVHIPVAAAVGISIYGYAQYGAFIWGLAPVAAAISLTLSRTVSTIIAARNMRGDVTAAAVAIGGACFVAEAFGVHLGLQRFNADNAAAGLMVLSDAALITASVIVGVMNLYSRRAFVTGLKNVTQDERKLADERDQSWTLKRRDAVKNEGFMQTIRSVERRERYGHEAKPASRGPRRITAEELAAAAAHNESKGARPMTASAHK